jgi:hypothetical protein
MNKITRKYLMNKTKNQLSLMIIEKGSHPNNYRILMNFKKSDLCDIFLDMIENKIPLMKS